MREHQVAVPPGATDLGNGTARTREPNTVTGIAIHQTGILLPPGRHLLAAHGGDRAVAQAHRVLRTQCHVVALQSGKTVIVNPLERHMKTSNSLNSFTIGLEVEGIFPGIPGASVGRDTTATPLTDATIRATKAAIHWIVQEGRRLGMPITHIYGHRQANSVKIADPGYELWQRVVLEYAVGVLGLQTEPHRVWNHQRTRRDGRPIPPEWSPEGTGEYR